MFKKVVAAIILCGCFFLLSGCETIKGTCKGASDGVKKDWSALKKIDLSLHDTLW